MKEIAPYGSAPERLARLPTRLLAQAAQLGSRLVDPALAALGLRKHHFAVLVALEETGPASQADLGRRLGLDRSDVTTLIESLEGLGAARRETDAADRRRNVVSITRSGRRLLAEAERRVLGAQEELLAPLTAAERGRLERLLGRVVTHAESGHVEGRRT